MSYCVVNVVLRCGCCLALWLLSCVVVVVLRGGCCCVSWSCVVVLRHGLTSWSSEVIVRHGLASWLLSFVMDVVSCRGCCLVDALESKAAMGDGAKDNREWHVVVDAHADQDGLDSSSLDGFVLFAGKGGVSYRVGEAGHVDRVVGACSFVAE